MDMCVCVRALFTFAGLFNGGQPQNNVQGERRLHLMNRQTIQKVCVARTSKMFGCEVCMYTQHRRRVTNGADCLRPLPLSTAAFAVCLTDFYAGAASRYRKTLISRH